MKKSFVLGLLFIGVFTISSCSEETIQEVEFAETITYNGNVRAIISNNCLPCHAGATPAAGLNLETFTNVRNATENGNLIARINNAANPMPVGGLMPPALIATIEQWATDGFIEN